MTILTVVLIVAACGYFSFRTTGKLIDSGATNVRWLGACFAVALLSVLTALPIALIGGALGSTLALAPAALFGFLAGETAFFWRAPMNPPAPRSR